MRHVRSVALTLIGMVATLLPARADLGAVVASYANWDVRRKVDVMTDKVDCVATYKGNNGIQLERDSLYITVSGGPEGFEYRFDEEPKSGMVLVSDVLQHVGAIGFEGALFNRVVQSHRLRVQVVTYLGVRQFDLDMNGIRYAYGAVYHCS
jgi:hypothetical protein